MSILLHIFWALINSVWQSAALATIVFLVLRSVRRTTAAQRYVIWGAVLVSSAMLPAIDLALSEGGSAAQFSHPAIALAIPYRGSSHAPANSIKPTPPLRVHLKEAAVHRQIAPSLGPAAPVLGVKPQLAQTLSARFARISGLLADWFAIHYALVALAVWVTVPNVMLVRLAIGYFSLCAAKRSLSYRQLTTTEQYAFRHMTLRPVAIGYSSLIGQPCVIGFARPVIALPTAIARTLPPPDTIRVLRHECAHISRWDDFGNLLQQIIGAILFFNPVVHAVTRALDIDREIACDDAAASAASERAEFAKCLYEIARGNVYRNGLPAAGFVRSRKQILLRVAHLLDHNHNGSTRLSTLAKFAAITIVAAAIPFAYVQVVAQASSPTPQAGVSTTSALAKLQPQHAPAPKPKKKPHVSSQKRNVQQRTVVKVHRIEKKTNIEEQQIKLITRELVRIHQRALPLPVIDKAMTKVLIDRAMTKVLLAPPQLDAALKVEAKALPEAAPVIAASQSALHLHAIALPRVFSAHEHDDFLEALHDSGFRGLSVDDLISIRNSGVSSDFLRELHAAGLTPMPAKELIEIANAGVSAEFLAGMRKAGYGNLTTKDMVSLCNAGVTPGFISALSGLGYTHLSVTEIETLANAGVDAAYIASLAKVGYGSLTVSDLVRLRDSGVTADFIERLTASGVNGSRHIPIADLVRLRNAGI